jgi:hypothetical protein
MSEWSFEHTFERSNAANDVGKLGATRLSVGEAALVVVRKSHRTRRRRSSRRLRSPLCVGA